jgi:hypothetical protein
MAGDRRWPLKLHVKLRARENSVVSLLTRDVPIWAGVNDVVDEPANVPWLRAEMLRKGVPL